jgi:aminopeptidase
MKHSISYYEDVYARLVLEQGVSLRKGQRLLIMTSPKNYDFAQRIAKNAYQMGSDYVLTRLSDYELDATRIEYQSDAQLEYVPSFITALQHQHLAEDWAYIRIDNTEDRLALEGVDSQKLALMQRGIRKSSATLRGSLMRHEHPWCVICAPGPVWAKQILGPGACLEDLYEILIPILRLDAEDPVQAWSDHAKRLLGLSGKLTDLSIRELQITDKKTGTDVSMNLSDETIWIGGPKKLPDGTYYFPNIPTEEVFTVPQRLSVNGKIVTTKPVTIFGSQVNGCSFTFKDGQVVEFKANTGQQMLEKFFETDEGASFVGELALVDKNSPIAQSSQVFQSILYDENAACHFALGAGYPSCFTNGKQLKSDEQLRAAGCNTSSLHTDFMFGSPTTNIRGLTHEGEIIEIMTDGSIVIG